MGQVMQSMCIDCKHRDYKSELWYGGAIYMVPCCEKGHDSVMTSAFSVYDCPDKERK